MKGLISGETAAGVAWADSAAQHTRCPQTHGPAATAVLTLLVHVKVALKFCGGRLIL